MKNIKEKVVAIVIIALSVMFMGISSYAHSGRTDSSGGHKDNKNKSGLGSYHYHCGGHPPHLHTNGVCPYSSSSKKSTSKSTSKKSSTTKKSSSSSNKTTTTKSTKSKPTPSPKPTPTVPATIMATGIEINEKIEDMKVGDSKILTASITPNNVTDKTITWKSSDETVATVSAIGNVIAKSEGIVEITASTSNGKTSTVKVSITEERKESKNEVTKVPSTNTNDTNSINDDVSNNSDSSNIVGTITGLGLLSSGGYWVYKKLKE